MILFKKKPWKLVTITSTLIFIIFVVLVMASIIIQISNYKFDKSQAKRNEYIISTSLLNSGLSFEVAKGDINGIESIINDYLSYKEIHAIEVRKLTREVIYRKQKTINKELRIVAKTYSLLSQYDEISIDGLDKVENKEVKTIAKVVITFSSNYMNKKITQQALFTGGLLFIAVMITIFFLYLFNRYIYKYLNNIINTMNSIKQGDNITLKNKGIYRVEELNAIYRSLQELSETIYKRDAQLKDSLNQAMEAKILAQEAEQFKEDFIRAISHDIKTPVGVIINLISMIVEQSDTIKDNPSLSEKVNACYESSIVLKEIMTELFNFEEFEQQKLIENKTKVNLNEIFSQIKSLYETKFSEKGLGFSVYKGSQQTTQLLYYINIDKGKLLLVLENLLDNALKFTESGAISITWIVKKDSLLIQIKDSGIGIPEDKYKVIFNKHIQLNNISTSTHQGRGLGLFYVKRIIDLLGAEITLSSKVDIGSVFKINIPITSTMSTNTENTLLLTEELSKSNFKALIIDDDQHTCFTLTEMLNKYGIETASENIPEIGLSQMTKESFDLAFIDFHMPNLSGDVIMKKLTSTLPKNTTFYVCITAESSPYHLEKLDTLFHEVLEKPFDITDLQAVLQKALKSKRVTNEVINNIKGKS
ncbi:hypothetical protein AB835_08515 [Candidatus Endobugula sertula]|uniref:histidine kinase n=1 Tax=Candidatus Endobugula sertula TaxID=62101 RepID=A0A1D2QPM6_9GAMM|nr:hypothetical protein AB835_08515 [Candidatus Endobugula sertula]